MRQQPRGVQHDGRVTGTPEIQFSSRGAYNMTVVSQARTPSTPVNSQISDTRTYMPLCGIHSPMLYIGQFQPPQAQHTQGGHSHGDKCTKLTNATISITVTTSHW